jgi:hypothetical protein
MPFVRPYCVAAAESVYFLRAGIATSTVRTVGDECRALSAESDFMPYMHAPKHSPQQEYRLKQRDRIEASPLIGKKFPRLKALRVTLEFFDAAGTTKQGEMKCKVNVDHAKSALWFGCPGVECIRGDFDLSEVLAEAVTRRRKVATGELRCEGTRKRGSREPVTCGTVLRYKLSLNYD